MSPFEQRPVPEIDPLESAFGRTIEDIEANIHLAEGDLEELRRDTENMRAEYQELIAAGIVEVENRQSFGILEAHALEYANLLGTLREQFDRVRLLKKNYLRSRVSEQE
jgi:hypothetical protein